MSDPDIQDAHNGVGDLMEKSNMAEVEYPYLECHTDTPDGATVGWRWVIDKDHSVWCGEVSLRRFRELELEDQENLHDDYGWFLILYGKTFSVVLGKALNGYVGRDVAEVLARSFLADPRRIDQVRQTANE